MIAFLIDADNFSSPAWIDEAFQTLERTEGSIAIRRAYGSAENLKGLADTLRAWAIRLFVNLPLPTVATNMRHYISNLEMTRQIARRVIGQRDQPLPVRITTSPCKIAVAPQCHALGETLSGVTGCQIGCRLR